MNMLSELDYEMVVRADKVQKHKAIESPIAVTHFGTICFGSDNALLNNVVCNLTLGAMSRQLL